MKRILSLFLLLVSLLECLFLVSCAPKEKFSSYSFDYFDTVTSITGYAKSKDEFDEISKDIMSELEKYHRLFTIYDSYEGINNLHTVNSLSNGVHTETVVEREIIDMLLFSKEMYAKTGGRVNVAMGSVLSIWHDYRNAGLSSPANASLPPMQLLTEAAKHTSIDDVIINEEKSTVFLADPELTLDVGAIAKGYAVEMVAQTLIERDIDGYVINVGGNVRTLGKRGDGKKWVAGVENPNGKDGDAYFALLELEDLSLVTSGSYQRYYTVNGVNYNHIIDPDTLMPTDTFISVSVLTEHSGCADAFSTALFTMSYEDGNKLIEESDGIEAMWVYPNGEIKYSSGFTEYTTDIQQDIK